MEMYTMLLVALFVGFILSCFLAFKSGMPVLAITLIAGIVFYVSGDTLTSVLWGKGLMLFAFGVFLGQVARKLMAHL